MSYKPDEIRSILSHFYEWEQQRPAATFLRQPNGPHWHTISWAEAGNQARRLVTALRAMGLKPGDHIGLISKNCCHWIIADIALMMGGYVSIPYYPNLTARQLQEVVEASDIKALFAGKLDSWPEQSSLLPAHLPIISFPHYPGNSIIAADMAWEDLMERYAPIDGHPEPAMDDLWTILFTSGTTGVPKGVMHTYYAPASLLHNERINGSLRIFTIPNHRFFSYLPLNHIAERMIVEIAAIFTGGVISFAENLDTFAKNLADTQPTLFMAVPRIWSKFQLAILDRLPQKRLSFLLRVPVLGRILRHKIRRGLGLHEAGILLTGAAPTPDALKEWFLQFGLSLQEVYAMTENCGGCTLMPADGIRAGSVGKALPGVDIEIDPQTGEVLTRAPWMMAGYYQDAQKTAEVLQDGWLHTGDQGELSPDGYLSITGRVSDSFKSAKGKFIVPAPIEWGFAENNLIEQVCVVGLAMPQPLALAVLSERGRRVMREEVEKSLHRTLAEINTSLAAFEQLAGIVIVRDGWTVENGILTPTLKIKRNALNEKYREKLPLWVQAGQRIIWED